MNSLMSMCCVRELIIALFIPITFAISVSAQTEAQVNEAMIKAAQYMNAGEYAAAVPHLAFLVKVKPDDANLRLSYGVALLTKSKQTSNLDEAKKLSVEALAEFRAAKRLGINDPSLDTFIKILGGSDGTSAIGPPTKQSPAEKFMEQAETNFAQSKYDEALGFYQKALEADPRLYEAALYMGDCYVAKQDWPNAEKSYQKAISIDPKRETAYRYSATPFMKQKKYDLARDRYIEAFITEPYGGTSSRGISQWAQTTGAKLGHPAVDIPKFALDAAGKPTTTMSESSLTTASKAWIAYSLTREEWRKARFAKAFPNEKEYRHSLQEEVAAIRSVLKKANDEKLTHPHFEILQKLEGDGLLESYILLAHADEGIAKDHDLYLNENRPKLRQYVLNYVIQK